MYCKYCGTKLDDDGFCPKCCIVFETQPHMVYEHPGTTYVEKPQETPRTSGMAVAGFVLAVFHFFIYGEISTILILLSLVFSLVGMSHTKKRCYAWQRVCRRRFIEYFDSIFLGIPVWICNSCPLI